MKKKNKSLLNKAFYILSSDLSSTDRLKWIKKLVEKRDDLNSKEKFTIYKRFKKLVEIDDPEFWMMNATIKQMYSTVYQIEMRSEGRNKKTVIKDTLKEYRVNDFPIIFYLCSTHKNCAKGHLEYQGKIYVDRYWKSTIENKHGLEFLIPACTAYIKNHNIMTVQDVTAHGPYLLTRPNCKHVLRPLDTYTVLTSSLNAIKKMNPDLEKTSQKHSRNWYNKEYRAFRNNIKTIIQREKD